jgi:hypothetical protein
MAPAFAGASEKSKAISRSRLADSEIWSAWRSNSPKNSS